MSDNYEVGTAANHYISQLYHEAIKNGLDIEAIFNKLDLSAELMDKPEYRVPTEKLTAMQNFIWQELQDESMRLAAFPVPAGSYFMMGRLTVNQPTLRKALELGCRFYSMVTQAFKVSLTADNDIAVLRFELKEPKLDPQHMFAEILLLAIHRYASWLIADSLPLIETHFNYSPPAHISEYSYLFPGIHIFESNQLGFAFPAKYLQRIVQQNDASLKLFMQRCPQEIFQRYEADYSLTSEIKRLVRKNLKGGVPSIEKAAEMMHMTKRTLMRRLQAEGTSYQQLKDVVRRDKAVSLLTKYSLPISQISENVGFSEPAVFTRAFLNWMGESPSQYRAKNSKISQ
ncbi:AraC family transcriptional regulator [Aliiglaciecola sp. LCG003]|uniref:AraC family transcriptional regulator n=1 Tax=Aliiglaciecola sp. LCG003 TaxID=3053655 RepID=UPI002572E1C1|nr:AraC family transcriptional regulator [Aliiglaciecola sp. LCG003]WJG09593.1 AraC family transcriptional regulator [Aliiglaciecola sp. LCG003]